MKDFNEFKARFESDAEFREQLKYFKNDINPEIMEDIRILRNMFF